MYKDDIKLFIIKQREFYNITFIYNYVLKNRVGGIDKKKLQQKRMETMNVASLWSPARDLLPSSTKSLLSPEKYEEI